MPVSPCFSYPADVPPGHRNGSVSRRPRPGVRRMPLICYGYPNMCFSYLDDVPQGGGTMTRCSRPSLTCAGCRAAPASATD
jgi:hypothetical protein